MKVYGVRTEKGLYLVKNGEDWCTELVPTDVAMWDNKESAVQMKKAYEKEMIPEEMIGKIKFKIWSAEVEMG